MPIPRVAIVGRPNVGKSSLLNMIAREKVSIVDPTAGTTRDRVSIIADLAPPDHPIDSPERITAEVTDTGGFGVYVEEGRRFDDVGKDLTALTDDIEFQISQAVTGADIVLFVIDAQAGVTAADRRVAQLLRERVLGERNPRRGKNAKEAQPGEKQRNVRIRIVANKCDGPRWEAHAYEAAGLGFGEPLPVSAKNNYFRRDFLDELYVELSKVPGVRIGPEPETRELKIAVIGKRNAGKSSLVNALAGEDRVIVSEIAGTTRDSVDVHVKMGEREFTVIDTAGLRKKKSFADRIEWWAFDRAQRSIERADVVLMLVDATEALSQVDQQLMKLVQQSYKPCVIVVNKWDLAEGRPSAGEALQGKSKHAARRGRSVTPEVYEDYLREETKGLDFAPLAFMSARSGKGVTECIELAFELFNQAGLRTSTGRLNRILRDILATRGPSSKLGTFAKAYFISQVAVRPPTIVLVVNKPQLFTNNYQKFLLNRLRAALEFPEVPIKLIIKERKRARIEDLLSGEHQRLKAAGAKVVGDDLAAEVEEGEMFDEAPGTLAQPALVSTADTKRSRSRRRTTAQDLAELEAAELKGASGEADESDDDAERDGEGFGLAPNLDSEGEGSSEEPGAESGEDSDDPAAYFDDKGDLRTSAPSSGAPRRPARASKHTGRSTPVKPSTKPAKPARTSGRAKKPRSRR